MKTIPAFLFCCSLPLFSFGQARISKTDISQMFLRVQLNEIKNAIKLDDDDEVKFDNLYRQYFNELHNFDKRSAQKDSLISNNEAEERILIGFETAKKVIETRESYYKLFKDIITPRQILIMYRVENDINRKISKEYIQRTGQRS